MEQDPKQMAEEVKFPDKIGDDYELWQKYHKEFGPEAYKWRRIAEDAIRHTVELYRIAEAQGVKFPDEMNFT